MTLQETGKKRTIAPSNISTDSAAQVPQIRPPKKARNMGA